MEKNAEVVLGANQSKTNALLAFFPLVEALNRKSHKLDELFGDTLQTSMEFLNCVVH